MLEVARDRGTTKLSRSSLADEVYAVLLTRLVDGTLPPGVPVIIDVLAEELAVSQTPIREALARLEATGLVNRVALKGYRAAPLFTRSELADLMDARLVIEPQNAYLACERSTESLVVDLERSVVDLEEASRAPTFGHLYQHWAADERFHSFIAEATGNRFLKLAFDALGGQVQRFRFFGALGATDAEMAAIEHRAVVQSLRGDKPEKAREAMANHLSCVRDRAMLDSEVIAGGTASKTPVRQRSSAVDT